MVDIDEEYKTLANEIIKMQYPYLVQMHYQVRDRAQKSRNDIASLIKQFTETKIKDLKRNE
jgi:hypothetical protein